MQNRTVWDMQDDFDSTDDHAWQEELRQEMRDNGYSGVADTIGKTGRPAVITAASFPTPALSLRSCDPAELDRVRGFAAEQARAANRVRACLAKELPGLPDEQRVRLLRGVFQELTVWRYELALAAPRRLGQGIPLDADRILLSIRHGGPNYDRLGYTGRMRDGATWDPATCTFRGGHETPASAIIEEYGRLARDRFAAEAPNDEILENLVTLPDGREFTGNSLVRGEEAARIASKLRARVEGRGRDVTTFEIGGDPVYAISTFPDDADILFHAALETVAAAVDMDRAERAAAWQSARYLLYQAPQRKKGSDAVTRVFLVAVGAVLFGQPPILEQDVDLRCMVLGQTAATEMPADESLRSTEACAPVRGEVR